MEEIRDCYEANLQSKCNRKIGTINHGLDQFEDILLCNSFVVVCY